MGQTLLFCADFGHLLILKYCWVSYLTLIFNKKKSYYFIIEIIAEKPNYEVGSSAKLSFAKSSLDKAKVAAVWKIDNDDDEIIDADELLDDEDLAAPDPASLRGNYVIHKS